MKRRIKFLGARKVVFTDHFLIIVKDLVCQSEVTVIKTRHPLSSPPWSEELKH